MMMSRVKKYTLLLLKYLILIFFAFIAVLPLYSCVITALKTEQEFYNTNVMTLPENLLNFDNFKNAFEIANMGLAFWNSAIILVFTLLISILVGTQIAYVLSRFKFIGNGLIRSLFLFASLIPGIAMQVTIYKIMAMLNLINSIPGYIILQSGTNVISMYIFIQYFENIDYALDESAIMDGASYFTIFYRILFPLLKPAMVTVAILKGVAVYNEYYAANLYLQDRRKYMTVAVSLYTFTGPYGTKFYMVCAAAILSFIPTLIIFIMCQKQIYSGIAAGAVKG